MARSFKTVTSGGGFSGDMAGASIFDSVTANGLVTVNGGSAGLLITDTAADHGARFRASHGASGVDGLTLDSFSGTSSGGSLTGTNYNSGSTAQWGAFGGNVSTAGGLFFSSTSAHTGSKDLGIYRNAAGDLRIANGFYGTGYIDLVTTATVKGQVYAVTSSVTSSTSLAGIASYTFTGIIPAGAIFLGLTARVTTAMTSASAVSWKLGTSGDDDMFGAGKAFTAGTTLNVTDYTAQHPIFNAAAVDLLVKTNDASNWTAGVLAVTVHYATLTPATSN